LITTTPLAQELKTIENMLPLLIPLYVIQLALMIIALIDLFKREGMKRQHPLDLGVCHHLN